MIRGCGYKESPAERVGFGSPVHLFSTETLPEAASVRQYVVEVLDQINTNSCVAHATTQQVRTALNFQGVSAPPLPSRLFVYYGARALNGEQQVDAGTFIHSAYECMQNLGFPAEKFWTFTNDQAKVNTQPDWDALRHASDQRWLSGHYRIFSTGSQRIRDVKAALAANHSVAWGSKIDAALFDLAPGGLWPGVTRQIVGGHAMLIVGYTPDYFEICNSWGPTWADRGFGRMSYDAIASPNASDFWVATVAPSYSELQS